MKRGSVELVGDRLRVRVRGGGGLAARLRTVPDAVWDGGAAYFPTPQAQALLEALGAIQVTWSADALALATPPREAPQRGQLRDKPTTRQAAATGDDFTPTSLNQAVGRLLTQAFPGPVWVTGQLDGWSKGHPNYFDLIERTEGLAKARAKLSARIRHRERELLESTAAEAGFELQDGLEVRLRGRVEIYVPGGSYQFTVTDVDVAFTLAKFRETRETVLAKLRGMGLAGRNLELPVPAVPLRIGIISATGSDALEDVLSTLRASGLGFQIQFHHSTMQGQNLERDILPALRFFYRHHAEIDALCLVRGGGSRSDLAQFDNLAIARGVCHQRVPVFVGIGHEMDKCVLDDVARSFRTPTAAASALVAQVREFLATMEKTGRRLATATRGRTAGAHASVEVAHGRLRRATTQAFRLPADRLDLLSRAIARGARRDVSHRRASLAGMASRLELGVRSHRREATHKLATVGPRLRRAVDAQLRAQTARVDTLEARRSAADPARVLRRGYAIVRGPDGLVQTADAAPHGTALRIQLREGTLRATSDGTDDDDT